MDDTVVWTFQSLCGDSGMKFQAVLNFVIIMYYVGILSVWAESSCSKISSISSVSWFVL